MGVGGGGGQKIACAQRTSRARVQDFQMGVGQKIACAQRTSRARVRARKSLTAESRALEVLG